MPSLFHYNFFRVVRTNYVNCKMKFNSTSWKLGHKVQNKQKVSMYGGWRNQ